MNVGKLDRKITIQFRALAVLPNTYGERVKTFTPLDSPDFETWALVEYMMGKETINEGQEVATQRVAFTIRYCTDVADITPADRVVYDGKNYDIQSVEEQGRNTSLKLVTVLVR